MDNHKTIEKNGKGFIIRLSIMQSIVVIIATILSIVLFSFMPYKAFTDYTEASRIERDSIRIIGARERQEIRDIACLADTMARAGLRYSIENNFNMKLYFELGQPDNFNWTSYEEIKKKLYLTP